MRVLDLGAGTGKLTEALVALDRDVIAVDPVEEMLEELEVAVPGVPRILGTAEDIPIEDASVDAVVAGQAWHWFQPDRAVPEIARVLRPGGVLGLVWNSRDTSVDWLRQAGEIMHERHDASATFESYVKIGRPFGEIEEHTVEWSERMSRARFLDLVRSRSYFITAPTSEQAGDDRGARDPARDASRPRRRRASSPCPTSRAASAHGSADDAPASRPGGAARAPRAARRRTRRPPHRSSRSAVARRIATTAAVCRSDAAALPDATALPSPCAPGEPAPPSPPAPPGTSTDALAMPSRMRPPSTSSPWNSGVCLRFWPNTSTTERTKSRLDTLPTPDASSGSAARVKSPCPADSHATSVARHALKSTSRRTPALRGAADGVASDARTLAIAASRTGSGSADAVATPRSARYASSSSRVSSTARGVRRRSA